MSYADFIAGKRRVVEPSGFTVDELPNTLFEHQRAIVRWACRMGRCAVFADTGLGKTAMQLEWARQVVRRSGGRVLILAPLAVTDQTIAEADRWGIMAGHQGTVAEIEVVNYERLHQLRPEAYAGVVLDESSILKSFTGSTRTALIEAFRDTPYRLCCTATPAPNDFTELGNHAEFLGVCTRQEMLAEFFVHDGGSTQDWRIKGHARGDFWKWVASWAVLVRKPSDLGIDDDARYDLPPLAIDERVVALDQSHATKLGLLFVPDAATLNDQRAVRRASVESRCKVAASLASGTEPCIVWCELNDESDLCAELIDGSINVQGSDEPEVKAAGLLGFSRGEHRVMVSKASLAGFGLNWQHCSHMIFVGVGHSYEQFYQAVRRCWRFGQKRPVLVTIVRTNADGAIAQNLKRKAAAADEMAAEMIAMVRDTQFESVFGRRPAVVREAGTKTEVPLWLSSTSM